MTAIKTYKPGIAAILLALYSFIAFAQLWHHHDPIEHCVEDGMSAGSDLPAYKSITKGPVAKVEVDCPLCAYVYSVHKPDTTLSLESSVAVPIARNGYYNLPATSSLSFSLPNKGPPCTA